MPPLFSNNPCLQVRVIKFNLPISVQINESMLTYFAKTAYLLCKDSLLTLQRQLAYLAKTAS